jgi:hypothetical protein
MVSRGRKRELLAFRVEDLCRNKSMVLRRAREIIAEKETKR